MRFCFRPFLCIFVYVVFFLSNSFTAEAQKRTSKKTSVKKEIPSVYDALKGLVPASEVCQAIKSGEIVWGIYSIMDYLAEHPKKDCQVAEQLLEAFVNSEGFDINKREVIMGRTQLPPLAYLIRTNYTYLNGHFSADYISDNALRLLIEAGARVNTYNTDGGSLMNFAIETNNKYLQSYFVEKGINLHHEDKTGTDDVYKLISAGSVAALKKAVDVGSVTLTVENLKNDTKEIAQYPELYDYVAQQCASAAKEYSSLLTFRQRFADRKSLVQGKWEAMAQAECNASATFDNIMAAEGRFPDLTEIVGRAKLRIYKSDCAKLQKSYEKAQPYLLGQSKDYSVDKYPMEFFHTYCEKYSYDPENKMQIAANLADFNEVLKGLTTNPHLTYWSENKFLGLVAIGVDIDVKRAEADQQAIAHAISIADKTKGYLDNFQSFFVSVRSDLYRIREEMKKNIERNNREYQAAFAEFKRSGGSSSSSYSSRSSSSEKTESSEDNEPPHPTESPIDIENISMPDYEYTDKDWIADDNPYWDQITNTPKSVYWSHKRIKFDDPEITVGGAVIGRSPDGKTFNISDGTEYTNEADAIKAQYVYFRYGKKRETGRKW